jgi:hypothetical protein
MCYSHFDNKVHNGAISITQQGLINKCYKVNPVGQWGKFLVMAMGFIDHLGPGVSLAWCGKWSITLFQRTRKDNLNTDSKLVS